MTLTLPPNPGQFPKSLILATWSINFIIFNMIIVTITRSSDSLPSVSSAPLPQNHQQQDNAINSSWGMRMEPENWSTYFGPILPPVLDYSIFCVILERSKMYWNSFFAQFKNIFSSGKGLWATMPECWGKRDITVVVSDSSATPSHLRAIPHHLMNKGRSTATSSTHCVVSTVSQSSSLWTFCRIAVNNLY